MILLVSPVAGKPRWSACQGVQPLRPWLWVGPLGDVDGPLVVEDGLHILDGLEPGGRLPLPTHLELK